MKTSATHNFHIPLSADLYNKLKETALRLGLPATQVARQALEAWVRQQKARALHEDIADFARQHGGGEYDLDEGLEDAAIEHLTASGSDK